MGNVTAEQKLESIKQTWYVLAYMELAQKEFTAGLFGGTEFDGTKHILSPENEQVADYFRKTVNLAQERYEQARSGEYVTTYENRDEMLIDFLGNNLFPKRKERVNP